MGVGVAVIVLVVVVVSLVEDTSVVDDGVNEADATVVVAASVTVVPGVVVETAFDGIVAAVVAAVDAALDVGVFVTVDVFAALLSFDDSTFVMICIFLISLQKRCKIF